MHHAKKGFKGFALRRRGRPAGSRAADRGQSDLFSIEKLLEQCRRQSRQPSERAAGAPPEAALPPATNRGGKFPEAENVKRVGVKF